MREISYSPAGVTVRTEDKSVYRADYVMVSTSLGVLQTDLIQFKPKLPVSSYPSSINYILCLIQKKKKKNYTLCLRVFYLSTIFSCLSQAWKVTVIYQFDMAVYTKIFLKFPKRFWPVGKAREFFLYASSRRGYYAAWQVHKASILSLLACKLMGRQKSIKL